MKHMEKEACGHYKPIYRERVIDYEDRHGNPCEYREEVLFAEFCTAKEDFIIRELECKRCKNEASPMEKTEELPLAG